MELINQNQFLRFFSKPLLLIRLFLSIGLIKTHCNVFTKLSRYIPFCKCGIIKTRIPYLLHCPNFSNERLTLFNKPRSITENILSKDDFNILEVFLFGEHSFKFNVNSMNIEWCKKYVRKIRLKKVSMIWFLKIKTNFLCVVCFYLLSKIFRLFYLVLSFLYLRFLYLCH